MAGKFRSKMLSVCVDVASHRRSAAAGAESQFELTSAARPVKQRISNI